MDPQKLALLLESVRAGKTDVASALAELKELPFAELGYATVDHHRALRHGVPEVIFGQGKTVEQIVGIAAELARRGQNILITRLDTAHARDVAAQIPGLRYVEIARVATLKQTPIPPLGHQPIALLSAGTCDLPVAEECAETLSMLGVNAVRVYDVGVAGIHRLLAKREILETAPLVIVVAGMEGALASAVGGLVSCPVIAVPTSVGYGVSAGGYAALLGMLSTCAAGVTVCNIDNGFGAAYAAARILRSKDRF